jgi:hypothetical protein
VNAAEIDIALFAAAALWAGYNAGAAMRLALTPDRPRAAVSMAVDRGALLVFAVAVLTASVAAHWLPDEYAHVASWLRRIVWLGLMVSNGAHSWWRRTA